MRVCFLPMALMWSIALLLTAGTRSAAPTASQPHLILIVADDLGWNDVSWHNSEVISPHLDALARGGIELNRSYVQPICTPTRTALLASRYPFTVGRQNNVIYPFAPTGLTLNTTLLPQELKKLGYDTHAVGKWHLGFCKWDYTPTRRGFDTFYGYYTGAEDYYTHVRAESMSTLENTAEEEHSDVNLVGRGYDFRNNTVVDRAASGNYSAFLFSERVESILSSRDARVPLFLYLPFQSVHAPLQVPERYSDLYSNIKDHNRRTYLGMVTAMDEAVGQVIASLKLTGHYNNSVIVFTTDNGGPTRYGGNNWPLRGNKSTLWEGGTRGSAFIHSPLLANPGTVSNRLVHATDWYPTFMHLAGGAAPPNIDGVNQWPSLSNSSQKDARDYFVYDIDDSQGMRAAIRWGNYKLIVGDPGSSDWIPPPQSRNGSHGSHEHNRTVESDGHVFERTENEPFWRQMGLPEDESQPTDMNENFEDKLNAILNDRKSKESRSTVNNEKLDFIAHGVHYLIAQKRDSEDKMSYNGGQENNFFDGYFKNLNLKSKLKQSMDGEHLQTNFQTISEIISSKWKLQLFDVVEDPTEHQDLSWSHKTIVKILLERLYAEFPRYCPKDVPMNDPRGDPKNFNSTWSPGWC